MWFIRLMSLGGFVRGIWGSGSLELAWGPARPERFALPAIPEGAALSGARVLAWCRWLRVIKNNILL